MQSIYLRLRNASESRYSKLIYDRKIEKQIHTVIDSVVLIHFQTIQFDFFSLFKLISHANAMRCFESVQEKFSTGDCHVNNSIYSLCIDQSYVQRPWKKLKCCCCFFSIRFTEVFLNMWNANLLRGSDISTNTILFLYVFYLFRPLCAPHQLLHHPLNHHKFTVRIDYMLWY